MNIKLNADRSAVVDQDYHYFDAAEMPPPKVGKLICINRHQGVATISPWSDSFTHWAPLPSFLKSSHEH